MAGGTDARALGLRFPWGQEEEQRSHRSVGSVIAVIRVPWWQAQAGRAPLHIGQGLRLIYLSLLHRGQLLMQSRPSIKTKTFFFDATWMLPTRSAAREEFL